MPRRAVVGFWMVDQLKSLVVLTLLVGLAVAGWWEVGKPGYLPLREVFFQGVHHTQASEAMTALSTPTGTNLLTVDLPELRKRIETLPWVRRAKVTRVFPDAMVVHVEEKRPVGIGREGERLLLLDEYGEAIKPLSKKDPLIFPVITPSTWDSEGAGEVIRLINWLNRHSWLQGRLSEAVSLSGDRWVLYTRRGIRILLAPTNDGLESLKRMQDQFKILDRKIRQVDLRIPGRAIVKP